MIRSENIRKSPAVFLVGCIFRTNNGALDAPYEAKRFT
jgi:hypothetical protein